MGSLLGRYTVKIVWSHWIWQIHILEVLDAVGRTKLDVGKFSPKGILVMRNR